jgi:intein/homing endonuclease
MSIVGWILVVIGVIAFLAGLWMAIMDQIKKNKMDTRLEREVDIEKILEKLNELLKTFKELSGGIQWAFLGLGCIAVGAYLLQM